MMGNVEGVKDFIEKHTAYVYKKDADGRTALDWAMARGHMEVVQVIEALSVTPEIGALVPGQGVYIGQYQPRNRKSQSLGKTFNAFAAPEDLPGIMRYDEAVKHISELKKWHGHNGANYATDKELYAAIKNGSYNGGWFMPTCDILYGKSINNDISTPDNLNVHRNKGAFKGTFEKAASNGDSYWSCSEWGSRSDLVHTVEFSHGFGGYKDKSRLGRCRPVRLVEVPDVRVGLAG